MKKMMMKLATYFHSEKGQGMVEYGLIIALIAVALITVLGYVTGGLENIFTKISTELGYTPGAGGGGT